jgi:uncharacterized protein
VTALLLGAIITIFAALLAGATGFGFALASAPFLLLAGFSLEFVVTVNLALVLLTRISTWHRLRAHVSSRRVAALIFGSVPGFYFGGVALTELGEESIRMAAGCAIVGVTLLLAVSLRLRSMKGSPVKRRLEPNGGWARLREAVAGFAGGALGNTTSLSGIPPALLLASEGTEPKALLADLAVFFVVGNAIALALLAVQGALVPVALFPTAFLWLPGAMLANAIGISVGERMPKRLFQFITLGLAFVAGLATIIQS